MTEYITSLPWSALLPIAVVGTFTLGIIWKNTQDKTVEFVKKRTIKSGELSVSELQGYTRTHTI